MPDFGNTLADEVRPLRLAFVCHSLDPRDQSADRIGGAERAAAELLAAHLSHRGVEVIPIVERASSDRLRFLAFAARAVSQLRKLASARAIDAVLFSAMPTAWMSLPLAALFKRQGVVSGAICHGHDVTMAFPPYQGLVRRTLGALDAVMPVSRATGDCCLERGLDPARLHVTPNGADASRFAPAPDLAQRRAILRAGFPAEAAALGDDDLVICTVGRQIRRKGHAWFVAEAMPRLPAGVHLWLAGDGPEAAAIDAAAARAGVRGRVRRFGAVSEAQLAALYRGSDLFVMPNVPIADDIEGFGLVMLEANLNGLPVVATDLEGLTDVVAEGVNGRLARALDPDAFAAAILDLRADPELRGRLGRQAETHARRHFAWAGVADRQVRLLRRIAA